MRLIVNCLCAMFIVALGVLFVPVLAWAVVECEYCQLATQEERILKPCEPAMQGRDVEHLQEALQQLGYYTGYINGIYESGTIEAVKNYQQKIGLKPDGVITSNIWQALDETYCVAKASSKIEPPPGEVSILVDTTRRKLTILSDGEPYKQYPVACGKYHTPSPVGNFNVLRKAMNWGTGFGTRWIGLTVPWGIYGIHGTNKPGSIGSYASHGCIRMNNRHVEEIYPWVKPGSRVILIGNPFHYQADRFRTMRRDERGGDVMEVQIRLQRLGFYNGPIDGIWGGGMERAIKEFREQNELAQDNSVNADVYRKLGL